RPRRSQELVGRSWRNLRSGARSGGRRRGQGPAGLAQLNLLTALFAREILAPENLQGEGGQDNAPEDQGGRAGEGELEADCVGGAAGRGRHLAQGIAGDVGQE